MATVGRFGARACVIALVAALGLTSCGGDDTAREASSSTSSSSTPSETASESTSGEDVPPGTPPCSDVWQDGAELDRAYDGCEQDGALVERGGLGCSSGQRLVTYADHFYAVLGGEITETDGPIDRDRGYVRTVRGCRA